MKVTFQNMACELKEGKLYIYKDGKLFKVLTYEEKELKIDEAEKIMKMYQISE